jgi:hypothetical protein
VEVDDAMADELGEIVKEMDLRCIIVAIQ